MNDIGKRAVAEWLRDAMLPALIIVSDCLILWAWEVRKRGSAPCLIFVGQVRVVQFEMLCRYYVS
jgi:hypothetical protein